MDDQLVTLSKIFTERIFRIPDYQRGYAWTDKQLKDFWSDLQQLDARANHYTGVLTLENVLPETYKKWDSDTWIIEAKNYQPYFVVDGQQRLTTAIILVQAILESLLEDEKLNFTDKKDIQKKFIFESKDAGHSRSYIFGYEKDNPSYEFLKTKIFKERSPTDQAQETIYTQNLERAKSFFVERISAMARVDVEILYRKVTQQLLFNTFTITQDVEVCVAFETMNNRGKPLSYLELLKNRLIYLSLKFDVEECEKNALRASINACWKDIYHNLGRNKEMLLDDDEFLYTHYMTYFPVADDGDSEGAKVSAFYRRVSQSNYATELLETIFVAKNISEDAPSNLKVTIGSIYEYVNSLQDSIQTWYKMWNPFQSDFDPDVQIWLDKLARLKVPGTDALVLVFLQKEPSLTRRLEFLRLLERAVFLHRLGPSPYRYRMSRVPPQLFHLAMEMGTNKSGTDKVLKTLRELGDSIAKDTGYLSTVIQEYATDGFYDWDGIRYFLFEYNLDLQSRAKTQREKIFWPEFTEPPKDFVTVEHIFPRQARHPSWQAHFGMYGAKQRKSLRDSLGNLLPLSRPKNSSLSNKPFLLKRDGMEDSVIGYRFGSYAENEVCKETIWGPEQILNRGMKLLAFMERRWDVKLGSDLAMRRMLGLAFL